MFIEHGLWICILTGLALLMNLVILQKPSLFINTLMKVINPNYEKIGIEHKDISLRNKVWVSLDICELDKLQQTVDMIFKNQNNMQN